MNNRIWKRNLRRRHQRGMTLIEIIVVIAILAMMGAGVAVAIIPMLDKAKVDRVKLDFESLSSALKVYYAKKGSYPDTGTGFKALVDKGEEGHQGGVFRILRTRLGQAHFAGFGDAVEQAVLLAQAQHFANRVGDGGLVARPGLVHFLKLSTVSS